MNLHLYTVNKLRIVIDPDLLDTVIGRLASHDLDDYTIIEARGRSEQGAGKRKVIEVLLPERQVNDVLVDLRALFARPEPILFYLEEVRVLRRDHLQ